MRKLKFLLLALAATISLGAWAETDVTNLLNDAAIASEANWGGGSSSGGNHSRNAAGYWESWHNTFTLTQTINGLDAGYYMVSIQGVVEGGNTTTAVLTATSGNNTATAYLRNNTRGDFDKNAKALQASPNLHRSYATVIVDNGSLTISFEQTANDQWIVYGQFKLHKLTAEEGVNQQALESALSNQSWGVIGSTSAYNGLNERYYNEGGQSGDVIYNSFTNMPKGIYEVSVTAAASYTSNRGFEGKTGDGLTVFRANGVDVNVPVYDRGDVDYSAYTTYTAKCSVGDDGELKFGLYNLEEKAGNWFIYGVNNITYFGDLATALATARSKAKAIIDAEPKMNSTVWNNLNTEYTNSENVSEDQMSDAIESLNIAIDNANTSIAEYAKMKVIYDKLNTQLTDEGLSEFNDYKTKYENCELTNYNDFREAYIALLKQYPRINADVTEAYIQNGNLLEGATGWTCDPKPAADACENDGKIGVIEFYAGYYSLDMEEYKMIQKITLPSGQYRLSSNAFYRYGATYDTDASKSEANMLCGTNYTLLPTLGSVNPGNYPNSRGDAIAAFESGYYGTSTDFKILEDGTKINVGYTGTHSKEKSWFISGPLKLTYLGSVSIEGYINDLKTALANVPEGKMNGTVEDNLENAVKSAEELIASYENDPTSVNAKEADSAGEALRSAIIAANSSIAVYKQIALINTKAESLDADGQEAYSETLEKYNNGELSTVEEAQTAYIAAVKAQTTPNTDWTVLIKNNSFETGNIDGWENDCDVKLGALNTSPANNPKVGDWFVEKYWGEGPIDFNQTIIGLPAGKYKVAVRARNEADANVYLYANDEKVVFVKNNTDTYSTNVVISKTGDLKIGVSCDNHVNGVWLAVDHFTLTYLGATATMTITDANWGTFCAPFDVTIPEGVKAYTAAADGNSVAFSEVTTTIPAGTPVVVYSAAAVNKEFNGKATKTGETCQEGALVGVYAAKTGITAETGYTNYVLQNNAQGVGFYKVAEGTISLNANRCYMTLATSAGAKDCVVLDGVITGINNILNPTDKSAEGIYDLNGRKLTAPQKGINIINGVKVIVK